MDATTEGDTPDEDTLAINNGPRTVTIEDEDLFNWPIINEEDEEAALKVLREGNMSGRSITKQFETEFADWQGSEYALGYNNGTASLLGAMYGAGVEVGDEVIAPSVTFWAAVLPCMSLGATPVYADIEPDSLCLDPESVEQRISDDTKAIITVHNYGYPADMDEILDIAEDYDIKVIEDVSHAQGGHYKGRRLGSIGDVGAMSLMSRKSFAIGEAGMLVTDDREIYERAVAFSHYARHGDVLERSELKEFSGLPFGGHKHRMHQISAAVGRVQLKHYDARIAEIQKAMNYFWDQLDDVIGIHKHEPDHEDSDKAGWYGPKGLYKPGELDGLSIDQFAEAVQAEGSACSPGCNSALHTHPLLKEADVYGHGTPTRIAHANRDVREAEDDLPVAEGIQARCFSTPWFTQYKPQIIDQHAEAYRKVVNNYEEILENPPSADD